MLLLKYLPRCLISTDCPPYCEQGVYITPAFPKLVYVLDEHNALKGGKYEETLVEQLPEFIFVAVAGERYLRKIDTYYALIESAFGDIASKIRGN